MLRIPTRAGEEIGVRPDTLYPWLQGKSRPKDIERIVAFLDSMPAERSGIVPTGYEYREYKKLAWYSQTAALSVLQKGKGRDPEGKPGLSGLLPELWSDWTETGNLR